LVHLRASAQLTPALLLRAILSGNVASATAALADLSGLPLRRVAGLVRDRKGAGFAALYGRAGLPAGLKLAFETAVRALHVRPRPANRPQRARISRGA